MKISLIHPSRSRPGQAQRAAAVWLNSAKYRSNIEYILSIDVTDTVQNKIAYSDIKTDSLLCYDNHTAIEAINRAAKVCTGDLIIVMSDDFNQVPFHWDDYLIKQLSNKTDFLVKTQDGAQPWIITLPMMDRAYYNRFGYVYYPEYKHMFCDTEMTHVGDLLGRKITLPIRLIHNHYTSGKIPKDAINVKNDETWLQGEALYLSRMMTNFGLSEDEITGCLNCDIGHINWLKAKGINVEMA